LKEKSTQPRVSRRTAILLSIEKTGRKVKIFRPVFLF
jgi:hypothetical protein